MRPTLPSSSGVIFFQFGIVAFCFVASTLYTEYQHLSQTTEQMRDITINALPSIEHLTGARAELRHVEERLDDFLLAGQLPGARDELGRSQGLLHRDLEAYIALPSFPDESAFAPHLRAALARLDQAISHVVMAGKAPPPTPLSQTPVREAADALDAIMRQLVQLNMRHAYALAGDPHGMRHRVLRHALLLNAVNVLLALGATLLVFRSVRGHSRVMEVHQRVLTERADELEQFAGRVAHDIVNPLSSVSLALGLIKRQTAGDEPTGALADRGLAGVLRAQHIVDGLLEFARAGARPRKDAGAEVNAVLDDVVSGVQDEARQALVSIQVTRAPGAPRVACSPGVLTSLLSNLLHNAIKYIGEGEVRRITVRVQSVSTLVRFEVADTGMGIPPELGDSIFEPHVRAREAAQHRPGIGLGLATVKRIVDAHGGHVGFRSSPGQGSLFWFELPAGHESPPRRDDPIISG